MIKTADYKPTIFFGREGNDGKPLYIVVLENEAGNKRVMTSSDCIKWNKWV